MRREALRDRRAWVPARPLCDAAVADERFLDASLAINKTRPPACSSENCDARRILRRLPQEVDAEPIENAR